MKTRTRGVVVVSLSTLTALTFLAGSASATTLLGTTTSAKRTATAHSYASKTLSIDAAGQATCKKGNQFTAKATWSLGRVTRSSAVVKKITVVYKAPISGKNVDLGRINLLRGNNGVVYGTSAGYVTTVKGGRSVTQTYTINKTVAFDGKTIKFRRYFDVNETGSEGVWCGGTNEFTFQLKSVA